MSVDDSLFELASLSRGTASTCSEEEELVEIPKEVAAKQLMLYLANDIKRTQNYRTMPFYLVFLIIFTSTVVAVNMANVLLNPDYYLNRSVREAMEREVLFGVENRGEMWEWLDKAASNVWLRTPKGNAALCNVSFEYHTLSTIDPGQSLPSTALSGVPLDDCCSACYATENCIGWVHDAKTATCSMYESITMVPNDDTSLVTGVSQGSGWHAFFPITLFVIRQWRVPLKTCDLDEGVFLLIPSADRYNIGSMGGCVNHYEMGIATTTPFGRDMQFISEKETERAGGLPPLESGVYQSTTTSRQYDMADAYTVSFPYSEPYEAVSAQLAQLRDEDWVDGQTRALSVDTVFFDPELNMFVHFKGTVEFFVTGAIIISTRSTPFVIWSFATPIGGMLFAVDILMILCVVGFSLETFISKRRFRKIAWVADGTLSVWEVFELANVLTFFFTYYARGKMWHAGYELLSDGHIDSGVQGLGNCTAACEERVQFAALAEFASQAYQSSSWFAPSVILAYLRLFRYLQFNIRLNALSETVKEARGDLVGMCLIFLIVCVGYTVAGTLLFAHEFDSFQTFFATASFLVRLVFTGDMSLWEDMTRVSHPMIVGAYLLSWYVICWLVLLNMILAVIAGAFSVVQENMLQAKQKSSKSIARDVKNYVFKYLLCCPQIRDTGKEEKEPSKLLYYFGSGGKDETKKKTFSKGWGSRYMSRRLSSLLAIHDYYAQKHHTTVDWEAIFMTEKTVSRIMSWARSNGDDVLADHEVSHAFQEAMSVTLGSQAALRVGERCIERMMNKMSDFERKLAVSSNKLVQLHETVGDHGAVIGSVTVQSSHTARSMDAMGVSVRQTVAAVAETASAITSVAKQQAELLTTAEDIAVSMETEQQGKTPRPRRHVRRTPPPSQRGSASLGSFSPSSPNDPGIKPPSPSVAPAGDAPSTSTLTPPNAYSWD